jgi:hypothetical protein
MSFQLILTITLDGLRMGAPAMVEDQVIQWGFAAAGGVASFLYKTMRDDNKELKALIEKGSEKAEKSQKEGFEKAEKSQKNSNEELKALIEKVDKSQKEGFEKAEKSQKNSNEELKALIEKVDKSQKEGLEKVDNKLNGIQKELSEHVGRMKEAKDGLARKQLETLQNEQFPAQQSNSGNNGNGSLSVQNND